MRHLSIVFLPLLALSTSAFGAPDPAPKGPAPKDPAKGPRLEVQSKALDFGEVVHGDVAKLKVSLKNTGTEPLEIRQVKPSCGCTVATFPRVIAPGGEGTLELQFDSSERPPGYQSFRVTIYTNDATQIDRGPYCTILNLRGEVRTLFRILPPGAFFGEVIRGVEPKPRLIRVFGITGQAKKGFTLSLAGKVPSFVKVTMKPWVSPNGRRRGHELQVRLLPGAPLGSFQLPLEFRTNIKEQPKIRVMCAALINTRINGPPSVHFGDVPRAKGAQRVVIIARRDGIDGIPLVRVRHDRKLLKVKWKAIGPRRLELEINVLAGVSPGPFSTLLELLFDDPHQGILPIPIYGHAQAVVRIEPSALLLPSAAKAGQVVGRVSVSGKLVKVEVQPADCGLAARVVEGAIELTSKTGQLPSAEARLLVTTSVAGEEKRSVALIPRDNVVPRDKE
jgi:hypothetical protein